MNKVFLFVIGIFCCIPCFSFDASFVFAEEQTDSQDIQSEISENVSEQLSNLNFDEIEQVLSNLSDDGHAVFGNQTFWQKVQNVIDGNFDNGYASYFDAIMSFACGDLLGLIPILATIIAITVLCSLVGNFRGKFSNENISAIVEFVVFSVVVVIVTSVVIELIKTSSSIIENISNQMEVIFPILLTLLASVGGSVSVGIFKPAIAILSSVIVNIFSKIIMPLLIFVFVLMVVANISKNLKFDKLIGFFKSLLKWFSIICFGVFSFVLVVQGIVAGSFDGVSIKAMRFALKSYVPVLGGYLSDGFNVAIASSILIKNAVGLSGLVLLFATILSPLINIIISILVFKLGAGILEPITDTKIHKFLSSVADVLKLLVMVLLSISFMYILSVGLLMCSGNAV